MKYKWNIVERTRLVLFLSFFLFHYKGFCQVDTSYLPLDSSSTELILEDTTSDVYSAAIDLKTPRKVMFRSLMLPGLGQIYNKSYWKVPLVYGALGGIGYWIFFETTEYNRFKNAYIAEIDGRPHEFSNFNVSATTLRTIRDNHRKNKELAYVALVAAYGLNALEAFVDAHLKTFDVTDDIKLGLKTGMTPTIGLNSGQNAIPSLGLKFNLH